MNGYGMPLYTAEALILRTYKLGEADRIVVFLTRDRGKKRGVAPNARNSRKRFGAALEPLTEVRMAYFEHERRELVGLNYAEPIRSPLFCRPTGCSNCADAMPAHITVASNRRGAFAPASRSAAPLVWLI